MPSTTVASEPITRLFEDENPWFVDADESREPIPFGFIENEDDWDCDFFWGLSALNNG